MLSFQCWYFVGSGESRKLKVAFECDCIGIWLTQVEKQLLGQPPDPIPPTAVQPSRGTTMQRRRRIAARVSLIFETLPLVNWFPSRGRLLVMVPGAFLAGVSSSWSWSLHFLALSGATCVIFGQFDMGQAKVKNLMLKHIMARCGDLFQRWLWLQHTVWCV